MSSSSLDGSKIFSNKSCGTDLKNALYNNKFFDGNKNFQEISKCLILCK
jgi:hypothetical protein